MILKKNLFVFIVSLVAWIVLVSVEVTKAYGIFLQIVFFASLVLATIAYIWANIGAHPNKSIYINVAQGVALSVVLIVIGVTLATNFKLVVGGSL